MNSLAQLDRSVLDTCNRGVVSKTDRPITPRRASTTADISALHLEMTPKPTQPVGGLVDCPDIEVVVVIARSTQEAIVVNVPSL